MWQAGLKGHVVTIPFKKKLKIRIVTFGLGGVQGWNSIFCEVFDVVSSCQEFDFAPNPPILCQGATENDKK